MFSVFENVFLLFAFVIIGFTLCKTGISDNKTSKLLSQLLVYVFLPSKIMTSMTRDFTVKYISEKYILIIAAVILMAVNMLVFLPISKKIAKTDYEKYVYWYSFVAPNFGYFGYPLAESLFGDVGLLNLIIFCVPASFFCYTIGFCVLTKTKMSIKNLLTKPPLIATFLGAALGIANVKLPGAISNIFDNAGNCMGPVAMILLGMVISEFDLKKIVKNVKVYILSLLRLTVIPVAIALVVSLFGNKELTTVTALMYAMPFGLNTVVYAKLVGEDCSTGAGLVTVSTLFSCLTIPIVITLFG